MNIQIGRATDILLVAILAPVSWIGILLVIVHRQMDKGLAFWSWNFGEI